MGTFGFATRMIPLPPSVSDKWQDIVDWLTDNFF